MIEMKSKVTTILKVTLVKRTSFLMFAHAIAHA
jgi:hypothetical protein